MTTNARPNGNTSEVPSAAWSLTRAAAIRARELDAAGAAQAFAADPDGTLRPVAPDDEQAVLAWTPHRGWASRLPPADPRAAAVELYLPVCSGVPARPITIGHLGQSLDGFIATTSGDSQFVTGASNIVHLHALRALCDAVVVGPGTVAADDPQLTTRLVSGPHPLRVVFDPVRRLTADYRVFTDPTAPTLYACERERVQPGEARLGLAQIVGIDPAAPGGPMAALLDVLRSRGSARVFIEGGGVTVSRFLEAGLLDRLHIAVAPLIIGNGRPAIRLEPPARLRDCLRPGYRVFRMGGDVLFDCDLRANAAEAPVTHELARVI